MSIYQYTGSYQITYSMEIRFGHLLDFVHTCIFILLVGCGFGTEVMERS